MSIEVSVFGALVTALLCGALGLLVPRIVAAVPEPLPEPDLESEADGGLRSEPAEALADKELYVDIAAGPRLAARSSVTCGVVGALVGAAVGLDPALLFLVPLVPVCVALALIDWRTRRLPTWIIKRTYAVLIPLVVVAALVSGEPPVLLGVAIGWAVMGGYYFLMWLIYPPGMGYGDVRLSGILGIALGYLGFGEIVIGAMSGLLLGALAGVLLSVLKVTDRKHNPFGPWMLVGGLVGIVCGPAYAAWAWGNLPG